MGHRPSLHGSTPPRKRRFVAASSVFGAAFAAPRGVQAQGLESATSSAGDFLQNLCVLLDIGSMIVAGAAVVLAVYQLAVARKRIPDVATLLVGGLLIAAAAQLTNAMISPPDGDRAAGVERASVPVSAHRIALSARCHIPPCRPARARAAARDAGDGAAIG